MHYRSLQEIESMNHRERAKFLYELQSEMASLRATMNGSDPEPEDDGSDPEPEDGQKGEETE